MKLNTYQKVALSTVGAVIFLIFVGGLVRASGAGLGCPDWPKCFGLWIPPISVAELPAGFSADAFNVVKTWTEYVNRLVGVIIGFLILATAGLSWSYRKTQPEVTYASVAALVMVLFQGWLGGQVVQSGLAEWLITVHMVLAMAIMVTLLFATFRATKDRWTIELSSSETRRYLFYGSIFLLIVTLIQLVLGTEVREAVDEISRSSSAVARENWLAAAGMIDEVHRTFSWAVLILGAALWYMSRKKTRAGLVQGLSSTILVLILFQITVGVVLYYFALPPAFQVLHLVGIAFLICAEFLFALILSKENVVISGE